ncbi:MAG: Maf family protein [Brevundimonas sp.]|uniref:Maf family protein n=1 Tax=Brevundimonas sp. TaxID=1871086 RepID=UPI00391C655C
MPAPLLLASASPRRLELLGRLGLEPDRIVSTDIDESTRRAERPDDAALRLACAKAAAAAALYPDHIVLGADTIVAVGRRILPKAETEDEARACLALLSGRNHRVITAVALAVPGTGLRHRTVSTRVMFKPLCAPEIDAYVATGEWRGKAGGYGIQGRAEALIVRLQGSFSGVMGLPLYETRNLLVGAGFRL